MKLSLALFTCLQLLACVTTTNETQVSAISEKQEAPAVQEDEQFLLGAARFESYLPLLQGKSVAMVVNQTSEINGQHLVDLLIDRGIKIQKIFAPEHGFRGKAAAGEKVADNKDLKTGLPIISLYGKKKKPQIEDLADIDIVVFDIQDVGVRFYTYLSSMHYVMEAAAENGVEVLVLDRPNPNGQLLDGPVLDMEYQSFVGMHEIPVAHGMTLGELAQMIVGEKWINKAEALSLEIVPCKNYGRYDEYVLPVKPSPNLPNAASVYLYPSLCFFEGTVVSCGRGTPFPFQMFGYPDFEKGTLLDRPQKMESAKYPKFENQECRFVSLMRSSMSPKAKKELTQSYKRKELNWTYLWDTYRDYPNKDKFINENLFIDKLAGSDALRKALLSDMSIADWKASYAEELNNFKELRRQYLIYPE